MSIKKQLKSASVGKSLFFWDLKKIWMSGA